MNGYQTFLTCAGREATRYLTSTREVLPAVGGKLCGSRENSSLFLCDSCLRYWNECDKNQLQSLWEFAWELRKSRQQEH